jgi:hypothetical protein
VAVHLSYVGGLSLEIVEMSQMAELEHIKSWGLRLHQLFFLQVAAASGCYGDINGHFAARLR